jgi:hypothetical protein
MCRNEVKQTRIEKINGYIRLCVHLTTLRVCENTCNIDLGDRERLDQQRTRASIGTDNNQQQNTPDETEKEKKQKDRQKEQEEVMWNFRETKCWCCQGGRVVRNARKTDQKKERFRLFVFPSVRALFFFFPFFFFFPNDYAGSPHVTTPMSGPRAVSVS